MGATPKKKVADDAKLTAAALVKSMGTKDAAARYVDKVLSGLGAQGLLSTRAFWLATAAHLAAPAAKKASADKTVSVKAAKQKKPPMSPTERAAARARRRYDADNARHKAMMEARREADEQRATEQAKAEQRTLAEFRDHAALRAKQLDPQETKNPQTHLFGESEWQMFLRGDDFEDFDDDRVGVDADDAHEGQFPYWFEQFSSAAIADAAARRTWPRERQATGVPKVMPSVERVSPDLIRFYAPKRAVLEKARPFIDFAMWSWLAYAKGWDLEGNLEGSASEWDARNWETFSELKKSRLGNPTRGAYHGISSLPRLSAITVAPRRRRTTTPTIKPWAP